jgi:hypothetical protein
MVVKLFISEKEVGTSGRHVHFLLHSSGNCNVLSLLSKICGLSGSRTCSDKHTEGYGQSNNIEW